MLRVLYSGALLKETPKCCESFTVEPFKGDPKVLWVSDSGTFLKGDPKVCHFQWNPFKWDPKWLGITYSGTLLKGTKDVVSHLQWNPFKGHPKWLGVTYSGTLSNGSPGDCELLFTVEPFVFEKRIPQSCHGNVSRVIDHWTHCNGYSLH